jgi:16S rRNA (cytidine1402-2'-O)-methyltransferase
MLYIVSTPIGNLEDITLRALRILKEVDYIAAEDTRHTPILLNKYEINAKLLSFHAFSSPFKLEKIVSLLKEGKNIALVSDAGTPGISDPGYVLVKRAIEENIKISPIPGPSAFLTGLSGSGLPINRFIYLGFLPVKKGRQTLINSLKEEERTVVFYESPHRILKTLDQLLEILGDRNIVLCRELTKIYEEFLRGQISLVLDELKKKPNVKGEFVVILEGNSEN